jgi:hypothetical protein
MPFSAIGRSDEHPYDSSKCVIMVVFLAVIQLISLISVVFYEYRRGSISVFLWATLLAMFGIPHTLTIVMIRLSYPIYVYNKASVFALIFNLIYLITRVSFARISYSPINDIRSKTKTIDIGSSDISQNRLLFILLAFVFIFLLNAVRTQGSLLSTSWGNFIQDSVSAYNLQANVQSLSHFSDIIVFSLGGLGLYFSYMKKYLQTFLIWSAIALFVIVTRNRITVLPVLTSIILGYIIKHKKIRFRTMLALALAGFAVIYIIHSLRLMRFYGSLGSFIERYDFYLFNKSVWDGILSNDGELGLRNYFIYYNNFFPNFNEGKTYLRLLFILIPTKMSFGLKPQDFAISMGSAWIGDFANTRYSMHPTLYGDVFANFGFIGVIMGVFYAFVAFVTDRIIMKRKLYIQICCSILFASTYVIIARGSVYNGFYLGMAAYIILILSDNIVGRLSKYRLKMK